MTDPSPSQNDDRGVSVWVVAAVVVAGLALLAVPLWWVLDTYVLTGEKASGTASVETTTSMIQRPDPINLALLKPVIGSGPGNDDPGRLVDGNEDTSWNSGGYAPQVVQIDLRRSSSIFEIRLLVGQFPDGDTEHVIFAWPAGEPEAEVLHVFEGHTRDRQWLSFQPQEPWVGYDRVGVGTATSPSWVAWFEIEVLGTTP